MPSPPGRGGTSHHYALPSCWRVYCIGKTLHNSVPATKRLHEPCCAPCPEMGAASWCSLEIGSNDILQSSTFALWILLGIAGALLAATLLCAWFAWSASHLSVEVTREALQSRVPLYGRTLPPAGLVPNMALQALEG